MRARYVVLCILVVLLPPTPRAVGSARGDSEACDALAARASRGKTQLFYLKAQQVLCLTEEGHTVWSARASHGRADGKKQYERDNRTPEGRYTVSPARRSAKFGLFLPISYPNPEDVRAARALGKRPGGDVGIHGPQSWYAFLGAAQALVNHSEGCIVVDEEAIQQLAKRVKKRTNLEILPALPRP